VGLSSGLHNCHATSAADAHRKGSPGFRRPCWEVDVEGVRDKLPYPEFDLNG